MRACFSISSQKCYMIISTCFANKVDWLSPFLGWFPYIGHRRGCSPQINGLHHRRASSLCIAKKIKSPTLHNDYITSFFAIPFPVNSWVGCISLPWWSPSPWRSRYRGTWFRRNRLSRKRSFLDKVLFGQISLWDLLHVRDEVTR